MVARIQKYVDIHISLTYKNKYNKLWQTDKMEKD